MTVHKGKNYMRFRIWRAVLSVGWFSGEIPVLFKLSLGEYNEEIGFLGLLEITVLKLSITMWIDIDDQYPDD